MDFDKKILCWQISESSDKEPEEEKQEDKKFENAQDA